VRPISKKSFWIHCNLILSFILVNKTLLSPLSCHILISWTRSISTTYVGIHHIAIEQNLRYAAGILLLVHHICIGYTWCPHYLIEPSLYSCPTPMAYAGLVITRLKSMVGQKVGDKNCCATQFDFLRMLLQPVVSQAPLCCFPPALCLLR